MRAHIVAMVLLTLGLVGCLSEDTGPPAPVVTGEALVTLDFPIHVVAVGFEGFDAAALEEHLEAPAPVYKLIRAFTTALVEKEPLQYDVRYVVHEAPESFAADLFAFAASIATQEPLDGFLAQYDRAGEQRVCPAAEGLPLPRLPVALPEPACADIAKIDALQVEAWIADHRAQAGLEFPGAGQTVFVLDSFTKGFLPTDSYHQYTIGEVRGLFPTDNLRAWGGAHDFVFLDVGAAPNAWDYHPWLRFTQDDVELYDVEDGPIWDYSDDMDTFYANVARNVGDAVSVLWARDPIYPFEYADKYVLPTYVIIDPMASTNPENPLSMLDPLDVQANTDEAAIGQAFRDLVPWAEVETTFEYLYLPDDDPGLAAALQDAKTRYSADYVDFGIVKKYLREHIDEYAPDVPGARVYPTFAFWLGEPSTGLYAYSDGDEWGDSWGVFFNVADNAYPCLRAPAPVCTIEDAYGDGEWWRLWNFIFVHELGHSFGLMHTHDSGDLLDDGEPTALLNWLWDSTLSSMTYRHSLLGFDAFDKELLLRAHAVGLAQDVLEAGETAPTDARAAAASMLERLGAGDYQGAFDDARKARAAMDTGIAATAASPTTGEPVTLGVEIPVTAEPIGGPPRAPVFLPVFLPDPLGLSYEEFPIEIPDGATAIKLEFRERDAPSHLFWSAFVAIVDDEYEFVTGAYNNGYDAVVLRNLDKCAAGCTGLLYAYSGTGLSYDVTITPMFGGVA